MLVHQMPVVHFSHMTYVHADSYVLQQAARLILLLAVVRSMGGAARCCHSVTQSVSCVSHRSLKTKRRDEQHMKTSTFARILIIEI